MTQRPVLFSVAHSSLAQGAVSPDGLFTEYWVSLRATLAAVRTLAGIVPVEMFDVGPFKPADYDDLKVHAINRCMPALAVEIHCNAGPHYANYSEVIHHAVSADGKRAASIVARTLREEFLKLGHDWPSHGGRANTVEHDKHKMFLLELTNSPAIIVEGLFISNQEQAAWLTQNDGFGTYGRLVAEGVRAWYAGAAG